MERFNDYFQSIVTNIYINGKNTCNEYYSLSLTYKLMYFMGIYYTFVNWFILLQFLVRFIPYLFYTFSLHSFALGYLLHNTHPVSNQVLRTIPKEINNIILNKFALLYNNLFVIFNSYTLVFLEKLGISKDHKIYSYFSNNLNCVNDNHELISNKDTIKSDTDEKYENYKLRSRHKND